MGTDPFDNLIDLPLDQGEERRDDPERPAEPAAPPAAPAAGAIGHQPTSSHPPGRRRRGGFWWPALLLLLLIAGAFGWYFFASQRSPALLRSDASLIDLGEVALGTSGEAVEVTLRNDGGRAFAVSELRSDSPMAVIDRDQCRGQRLQPEESCAVALRLRPTEAGPVSGRLTVTATAANSPLEIPWMGTGTAPRAELEPAALAFGTADVGQVGAPRTLTVRNRGVGTLAVREVVLEGTSAGEFQRGEDTCRDADLAAGESCRLEVSFAPRLAGTLEASLRLISDSAKAVPLVWLSGTGVIGARLRFAVNDLDFGIRTVGAPAGRQEVMVVHEGSAASSSAVGITAVEVAEENSPFEVLEDGCAGQRLASGQRCAVTVGFVPTEAKTWETPLRLRLEEEGEGPWIPLRGVGAAASLERQPEGPVDFGEQALGASSRESVLITFTNSGQGSLPLGEFRLVGDDRTAFALLDDGCGGRPLAPNARCAVRVRFLPTAEGLFEARLEQETEDPQGASGVAGLDVAIPLRGVGAAAALGIRPSRLDLGTVRLGQETTGRLAISNPGRAGLTLKAPSLSGEGFSVDPSACPPRLEPGASCVWEVRFSSRRPGEATGRLRIESNAGAPREVPLVAEVTVPARPEIAIEPSRLDFGGQPVGERGEILDLVIRNPGTGRLVLEPLRLEDGDFRLIPGSCEGAPFLAPGGDCTVGVRFLPTAAGRRSVRLRIAHNAGPVLTVTISGEGL